MDYNISCERNEEALQYTVRWSPWGFMDRWVINSIVPSEAGMFQFWIKDRRGLTLLSTESNYYGGLRNTLREVIDEMAPAGKNLRNKIRGRECWFRFSVTHSMTYMEDLKLWFSQSGGALNEDGLEILVRETETLKRYPVPEADLIYSASQKMKDAEYGPALPDGGR